MATTSRKRRYSQVNGRRVLAILGGIVLGLALGAGLSQLPAFTAQLNGSTPAVLIGLGFGIGLGMMFAAIIRGES
jgi:hypothetical protein